MSQRTSPLDHVTVAAPCSAGWESMIGDERVRFCGQCNLNVYNLSAMTKEDAEHLVTQAEGRLCIRFYRRADGTILTRNCPVGLRALKRRLSRIASASASAVISFFAGILVVTGWRERPLIRAATQGQLILNIDERPPEVVTATDTFESQIYPQGQMVMGTYAPITRDRKPYGKPVVRLERFNIRTKQK